MTARRGKQDCSFKLFAPKRSVRRLKKDSRNEANRALQQRKLRIGAAIASSAAIALSLFSPQVAVATPPDAGQYDPSSGFIEVAADPEIKSARAAEEQDDSPVPDSVHETLSRLNFDGVLSDVNAVEWDGSIQKLNIYRKGADKRFVESLAAQLPGDAYVVVEAANSKDEIDAVLEQIIKIGGDLREGTQIVTASPSLDGSLLIVGATGDLEFAERSFGQLITTPQNLKVTFEEAEDLQPVLRNISSSIRFAGAYMTVSSGGGRSCSTGFAIGTISTPRSWGMISADHCGRDDGGGTWRYSSGTAGEPIRMQPFTPMSTQVATRTSTRSLK